MKYIGILVPLVPSGQWHGVGCIPKPYGATSATTLTGFFVCGHNKKPSYSVGIGGKEMSHTRRIYNNPRLKKAQRYNLDDGEIHLAIGIPYTRRSYICMGHCRLCRDPNKEPRLIRKRKKEQFRLELKSELEII